MKKITGATLAFCAILALGGCEAVIMGVATPGIIAQKRVNLLNSSYAAAEILAQRAGKRLPHETVLIVSDLQEIPDTRQKPVITSPKVGQVIGGQIRERFFQLGYNVVDTVHSSGGYAEVHGTYEIKDGTMRVELYVTDRSKGGLVTSYGYSLPATYDITKYMTRSANSLPPLPPLIDK
jgi:hypothetical protein